MLIVAGRPKREQDVGADVAALLSRLSHELPAKQAAAVVADWSGLRKKQLYEHLLMMKRDRGE